VVALHLARRAGFAYTFPSMSATPLPADQYASASIETELTADEVASQLGIPLAMLVRRIEAGAVPARAVSDGGTTRYLLRATDLGLPGEREGERDVTGRAAPVSGRGAVQLAPLSNDTMVDPRHELATTTLDPRELVAGLLDRWERALEQRIYAEQRQRFDAELSARQSQIKQLQLELDAARAEHAAALADRERRIAERERDLAEALTRRRGFFRRR
jgi:hypothetical protein